METRKDKTVVPIGQYFLYIVFVLILGYAVFDATTKSANVVAALEEQYRVVNLQEKQIEKLKKSEVEAWDTVENLKMQLIEQDLKLQKLRSELDYEQTPWYSKVQVKDRWESVRESFHDGMEKTGVKVAAFRSELPWNRPEENPYDVASTLVHQMEDALDMSGIVESSLGNPLIPEESKEAIKAFMEKHFSFESLAPEFIEIYAELLTVEEMEDLIDFYNTDTGKRLLEVTPELMTRGQAIANQRVLENIDELQSAMLQGILK